MPKHGEVGLPFVAIGRSNAGRKMLSFSCSETPCSWGMSSSGYSRKIASSICEDEKQRITGGACMYLNVCMFFCTGGPSSRLKWSVTPSQWLELQHQALIYKHIVANVPVPSNLLVPLKRSPYPLGLHGSYDSTYLGLGPFHLGLSVGNDPEPGRCRRTDGKKWRCSRDAVPDQKYCERHINRGRQRSRKPVEGQTGHAVSGSTTSKLAPVTSSSSASVISRCSSLGAVQSQFNYLQANNGISSADNFAKRSQEMQDLSLIPCINVLKFKDVASSVQEEGVPFEKTSETEFGLVTSDSLVRVSLTKSSNPESLSGFHEQEGKEQNSINDFINVWPKDHSNRAYDSWPEKLNYDWTPFSMSIPMALPDFSSSPSSPKQEKSIMSSPRLPWEHNPIQMSLGTSNLDLGEPIQKHSSWSPISWGNSIGGPLGEALTSTTRRSETLDNFSLPETFGQRS
ncbi:growth-regulating factor 1-like [Dorcoceras hygrometricum]|uniref:Growth-regulating factor n=1 Tax=Dorcoceras hygrometricum TaxID=472368 RepID=A0A2Z7AZV1_9LAMI|nr:growth-regulating factor 1-like [Dorcoceras hygrometricum]